MILLFILASIGLTHLLVEGEIFQWWRDLVANYGPNWAKKMSTCFQCTGFWVGLLTGWICLSSGVFVTLACGWASSFLCTFSAIFLNYLEAKTIINLPQDKNAS